MRRKEIEPSVIQRYSPISDFIHITLSNGHVINVVELDFTLPCMPTAYIARQKPKHVLIEMLPYSFRFIFSFFVSSFLQNTHIINVAFMVRERKTLELHKYSVVTLYSLNRLTKA